jgi:16S rRNA processing protein RimM
VAFTGVWSIDDASKLVGKTLLVAESQLPASFAMHDVERLIGREVEDASRGPLGTIDEVMQGVANDVWVVRGPLGEVLIPVVDEMVLSVEEGAPVQVDLPQGLVEGE